MSANTITDTLEILNVWSEYGRNVDELDYDALMELFTPDVVWGSTLSAQAQGRENVKELFQGNQSIAAGGDLSKKRPWAHIMSNPWVSVDDATAAGKFYVSIYFLDGPERKPVLIGLGDYLVEFVRDESRWLIKSVFLDVFTHPGV